MGNENGHFFVGRPIAFGDDLKIGLHVFYGIWRVVVILVQRLSEFDVGEHSLDFFDEMRAAVEFELGDDIFFSGLVGGEIEKESFGELCWWWLVGGKYKFRGTWLR